MKSNSLKKLLSVVLLLMMIVSMLPSAAFAEEAQPADEPVLTEQTVKAEENKDEKEVKDETTTQYDTILKYDGNGDRVSNVPAQQSQKVAENQSAAFTIANDPPKRMGYEFIGWNTSADGSGICYAVGGEFTFQNVTADVSATLYAQWKEREMTLGEIRYWPNGGDGPILSIKPVYPGTYAILSPADVGFTAPSGKTFDCWTDSEKVAEGTTTYKPGDEITISAGQTVDLWAQWSEQTAPTPPVEPNWSGLSISKTVDKAFAMPGDTITYTITVVNDSPDDLTDVVIYDELPSEVTYVSHTVNPLTPAEVTKVENNYIIEMLGANTTVEFTITATVNDDVPIGTDIVNEARASRANGYQNPGHTPMDSAATVVGGWSGLSITKTVDKARAMPGDELTYTIKVKNDTGAGLEYIEVSDPLPAGVELVEMPEHAFYEAGRTVNVPIYSLAAGAEKSFTITVKVLPDAPDFIPNTAAITYAESDSKVKASKDDLKGKTASAATTIVTEAEPVAMPAKVTVSFVGLDSADKFPAYTLSGAADNEILSGAITLTKDETAKTYTYNDTVFAVPGKEYTLSFTQAGYDVEGYTCDAAAAVTKTVTADKEMGVAVEITLNYTKTGLDGLTITKTADKTYATPGSYVKYTITVTNNTGVDLTNVNVLDYLPDEVRYSSSTGGYDSGTSSWTIASLADGKSATATIRVKLNSGLSTGTKIENTAYVTDVTVDGQERVFDNLRLNDTAVVTVTNGKGAPKTGDESNLGLWIAVMAASLACAGAAVVVYKKRRNGDD